MGLGFWAFYGDACRVSNHILFPGTIVMPACMFDNSILRVKAIRLIMSVSVCVCVCVEPQLKKWGWMVKSGKGFCLHVSRHLTRVGALCL